MWCLSGIWWRNSSNSVSKVPIGSHGSISAHSARTRVVFPAPCGPETTMLLRARTAARRKSATTGVRDPVATKSDRVTSRWRCRRITTESPAVSSAAASRAPPSRLRCRDGFAGLNGRGLSERPARKARKSASSSSLSATGSIQCIVPSENSATTRSNRMIMMFSIRSSSISGCSRPSRNTESKTAWAIASCSTAGRSLPPLAKVVAASSSSTWRMIAQPCDSCSALLHKAPPSASDSRSDTSARNPETSAQSTPAVLRTERSGGRAVGTGGTGGCQGGAGEDARWAIWARRRRAAAAPSGSSGPGYL